MKLVSIKIDHFGGHNQCQRCFFLPLEIDDSLSSLSKHKLKIKIMINLLDFFYNFIILLSLIFFIKFQIDIVFPYCIDKNENTCT